MRTVGKDVSSAKRGQRKTHKAEYGVCGEWLAVCKWKWDEDQQVVTLCLDDGERLHVMFVYDWELEAVMTVMHSTYSWSKHLASRLLVEAVFVRHKPHLWVHGLVRPHVVEKQIVGVTEEHAERLTKVRAPWMPPEPITDSPLRSSPIRL